MPSKRLGLLLKPMANCGVLFRQVRRLIPPLGSGTEPRGLHDARPGDAWFVPCGSSEGKRARGTLTSDKLRGLRPVNFERLMAEARYQHGTPQHPAYQGL